MQLKPIATKKEYEKYLNWVDEMFEKKVKPKTDQGHKDLVGIAGSKGYVSAVLNKKKPLTLELAKIFHKKLGISAEVLLAS